MSNRDWFGLAAVALCAPHIEKPSAVVMVIVFLAISLIFKE